MSLPNQKEIWVGLNLLSSQIVYLFNDNEIDTTNTYRLIIAERKEKIDTTPPKNKGKVRKKENIFYFITNNMSLTPKGIAQIYKQRWDIEVSCNKLQGFNYFLGL